MQQAREGEGMRERERGGDRERRGGEGMRVREKAACNWRIGEWLRMWMLSD